MPEPAAARRPRRLRRRQHRRASRGDGYGARGSASPPDFAISFLIQMEARRHRLTGFCVTDGVEKHTAATLASIAMLDEKAAAKMPSPA